MFDLSTLGGRYKLVYVDPAWEYYGDPDKPQAAGKHYNTVPIEEMMALPVRQLMDGDGVVFMWATGPKLAEAIDLLRAWGFHYRGIAYVWIKTTRDGRVIEGQGIRPSFVKQLDELVIVGSTQPEGRTLPILTESQGQNIFEPRPDGVHSRKPEEARWRIEELFGDIPRIELFARCRYSGWDAWGLEADGPMPSSQAKSPKLRAHLEEQEAFRTSMEIIAELEAREAKLLDP
jgi:N6-adenosine-specific RNA methylase IME4